MFNKSIIAITFCFVAFVNAAATTTNNCSIIHDQGFCGSGTAACGAGKGIFSSSNFVWRTSGKWLCTSNYPTKSASKSEKEAGCEKTRKAVKYDKCCEQ
eukprot:Pgem_evm1s10429